MDSGPTGRRSCDNSAGRSSPVYVLQLCPANFRVSFTITLALALAATNAASAHADERNRNLLPIGEREAVLANTGITSATAGAAFYNPANLAVIDHPSLSMTGTTLLGFESKTDAFLVADGRDQPFESSGFLAIPASLVSTFAAGSWSLATSVLVPNAIELRNQVVLDLGDGIRASFLDQTRQQDLWLGFSGARSIGNNLSIGVTAFAARQTGSSVTLLLFGDEFETSQTTTSTETSTLGLTAVGGVRYQFTSDLCFGLRAQTPVVNLTGSADIYEVVVDSTGLEASETNQRFDYKQVLPWDIGIGGSYQVHPRLELLADINAQLPSTIREIGGDDSEQTELVTAVRASVAADIKVSGVIGLQLGVLFNGSAEPKPEIEGESRENYVGGTLGLSWQSGRTRTGIGAFFAQSSGELIPIGAPDRSANIRSRLFGGLLTVAYRL